MLQLTSFSRKWGAVGLMSLLASGPCEAQTPNPNYTTYFVGTTNAGYNYWPPGQSQGIDYSKRLDFRGAPVRRDVVILYMQWLGEIPYGGPHLFAFDVAAQARHIAKIAGDLDRAIPDPGYSGLAIIDYERWSILWDHTMNTPSSLPADAHDDDYKDDWTEALLQHYPSALAGKEGEARNGVLRTTYDKACRDFYLATLQECKRLRPNAKWGFYGYPIAHYKRVETGYQIGYGQGPNALTRGNDSLDWLWDAVDWIGPSPYPDKWVCPPGSSPISGFQISAEENRQYLASNIAEAIRVAHGKPVYAITYWRYGGGAGSNRDKRVNWVNRRQNVEVPYLTGADGMMMWEDVRDPADYEALQDYLTTKMSPTIKAVFAQYYLNPTIPPGALVPPQTPGRPENAAGGAAAGSHLFSPNQVRDAVKRIDMSAPGRR